MTLPVLFEDADLVAVHKPSGLLVHRSLIDRHEKAFALQIVRDQLGGAHVFPLHRLDRPTSGVLLFARSVDVARELSLQFQEHRIEKEYLAVVRGVPLSPQRIDYPLQEEPDAKSDARAREGKPAQEARTEIEVVAEVEFAEKVDRYPTARYALVRARPITGRKHQIRRHLRHVGSPLIGDVTYGVGKHNRFFAERFGVRRLLLACTRMSFVHPRTGESVHVRAPLAEELRRLFERVGWGDHLV